MVGGGKREKEKKKKRLDFDMNTTGEKDFRHLSSRRERRAMEVPRVDNIGP